MDIFSLPHKYLSIICNEPRNAVMLVTALNWRHHGAPGYVNHIHAFADSDFTTNLIASRHITAPQGAQAHKESQIDDWK